MRSVINRLSEIPLSLFGREAFRSLSRHKLRSTLSIIGITVGIAAVVCSVAIGAAGSLRAEEQLQNLGDNLIWIEAGSRNVNGVRSGTHGMTTLTMGDAKAILTYVPLIKSVSPNVDGSVGVIAGDRNWTTRYRGVTPDFLEIRRWDLAEGTVFTDYDVEHSANVCMLGETLSEELFGPNEAVGREIRVNNKIFRVTGVLAPKGQTYSGHDQDDIIIMPYTTVLNKLRGQGFTWLDDIMCSAVSLETANQAIDQISALLRERHHIMPGQPDDFNIRHPEETVKALISAKQTYALLLFSIASISLVVGGIGIMNVMLASVTERTGEIGIRLAVGAKRKDIQLQFLVESVMLGLFGGLLGIFLGITGSFIIEHALEWPMSVPLAALIVAPLFAVGVGVSSGFFPAWKASQLDPITALRRE
jgi:putative ABC transport system permease protein